MEILNHRINAESILKSRGWGVVDLDRRSHKHISLLVDYSLLDEDTKLQDIEEDKRR